MGYCRSHKHFWTDDFDAERCCDPRYERVQSPVRQDLVDAGAEYIVLRQFYRGWKRKEEEVSPRK